MKRFTHLIGVAVLVVAALTLCGPMAQAGRVGGPMSEIETIPAYQSAYFDIPFRAGEPAIVSTVGNGNNNLELNIFDADGHMASGTGFSDRKITTMYVYRPGVFRVEVRNLGPGASTFRLNTN